jgi:hypothetical protein
MRQISQVEIQQVSGGGLQEIISGTYPPGPQPDPMVIVPPAPSIPIWVHVPIGSQP